LQLPLSPRAVRARRAADTGCPHRHGGPAPSTPPPARPYTPSPARRGRRGRTRDYKSARATTNPRARPQNKNAPPPQHRKLIDTGDIDAFWLIFGGVLVFWMQAGFAMLEVGSVNKKNTKNILVKNIFDACIAAIMWWAFGSALAGGADDFRSDGSNGFAGTTGFFRKFDMHKHGNRSAYAKASWFFGWTFAGAGCTIVSGAIAERATFLAYALYSVILTGFVYPPVVHMMWTSGKFSAWSSGPRLFGDCGVIDFAGSGTVHMTGGVAAIIAAACIGVRKGFPDALPEGQPVYQALDSA